MVNNKNCIKCLVKLTNNNWSKGNKKKHNYICTKCSVKMVMIWAKKNPEKRKLSAKRWRDNNKQKVKFKSKKSWLKTRYGLTIEQYDKMIEESGGFCKICKKQRKLCIDHRHLDGKIRGLICRPCNSMLGWFENYRDMIMKHLGD